MSWASLPPELQGLVLGRLEAADYLRFGAVCRSWCWTVAQRLCLPKPQIPWLMLSDSTRDPDTRRFFSQPDQKMYKIHLPAIHGRLCIGSSEGWLITVDEISELHALNPLTGASLALPSVITFPDVGGAVRDSDGRITNYVMVYDDDPREVPYEVEHMRVHYYLKAILHPSSAAMVVIHGEFNDLAFANTGVESWTALQPPVPLIFIDIIFRKGLLHAVAINGELIVFDLDAPGSPAVTSVARPHSPKWERAGCYNQRYLVESPDGKDLFQVWRNSWWLPVDGNQRRESILPGDARMTIAFAIFKLDERRNDWSEVTDLGDLALFLGLNRSMALSTREFPELTSSSIYFTDDYRDGYIMDQQVIRDVGVFNLKDGSFQRYDFHSTDSEWNWPPQIWFTPAPFSSMPAASSKP